jgi:hypothetical protein
MQELVIVTWCDVCAAETEEQDGVKVPAVRIHWMLDGALECVDLCENDRKKTSLEEMDNLVRAYGHPDDTASYEGPGPANRRRRRKQKQSSNSGGDSGGSKRKSVTQEPAGPWELTDDGNYRCLVAGCKAPEPFSKMQGLKMHQLRAHLLQVGS